ncbi:MAG: hypothetical protein ACWA5P_13325 [bacterium]
MSLIDSIRNKVFSLVDRLSGGAVQKHFTDIQLLNSNYLDPKVKAKRDTYLQNLLIHVSANVPYYHDLKSDPSLSDFPIIDKNIINANFEKFKAVNIETAYTSATSGSTGTPFFIEYDLNKKNRNTADSYSFAHKTGYTIGSRIYLIRIWKESASGKSPLKAWLQNIKKVEVDMLHNDIEDFVKMLKKDRQSKTIIGHASSLDTLANYMEAHNLTNKELRIRSIIPNAERCDDTTKAILRKRLGVPVVTRYSNTENGIIAQESNEGGDYYDINWASYYVEILDVNTNEPVTYGEIGRIVVTDLFNYRIPFVRYDTGDLGSMIEVDGEPRLRSIEGRVVDVIYDINGRIVPSFMVHILARKFDNIDQIQFIQHDKAKYEVIINSLKGFTQEAELIQEVYRIFGEPSEVKVTYVSEIPLLSSGKRRSTINHYKPS